MFSYVDSSQTLLTPKHCICPTGNYTCEVNSGIEIEWRTSTTTDGDLEHDLDDEDEYVEKGGLQVFFRRQQGGNFSSTLHVRDLGLNETNLTCEGVRFVDMAIFETRKDNVSICIVGNT